jgi:hypothetical protein
MLKIIFYLGTSLTANLDAARGECLTFQALHSAEIPRLSYRVQGCERNGRSMSFTPCAFGSADWFPARNNARSSREFLSPNDFFLAAFLPSPTRHGILFNDGNYKIPFYYRGSICLPRSRGHTITRSDADIGVSRKYLRTRSFSRNRIARRPSALVREHSSCLRNGDL